MRSLLKQAWRGGSLSGRWLSLALLPAAAVYGVAVRVSGAMRRHGAKWSGDVPAVLVGNLTVGGTGKTPLVAMIAGRLLDDGFNPAIISRGYGGAREDDPAFVSDGRRVLLSPVEAGDEPVMLARALPRVPVVVGIDRVRAAGLAVGGAVAGADWPVAGVVVLDDGFQQRWRFPFGFRVVVLNAVDPFGNGRLLPAGPLRESVESLRDADAVVLTHASEVDEFRLNGLRERIAALAPRAWVAALAYRIGAVSSLPGGEDLPEGWFKGKRVLALSAIGYPEGFELAVRELTGVDVVSFAAADHHRWRSHELDRAFELAMAQGCDAIVTTEKDSVRLPSRGVPSIPLRQPMQCRRKGWRWSASFRSAAASSIFRHAVSAAATDAPSIPLCVARLAPTWVAGEESFFAALAGYLRRDSSRSGDSASRPAFRPVS